MKKTKGKVLSLILASAMIVSSFSSMMGASAASSSRETGKLSVTEDELYLVSNTDDVEDIDVLLGSPELETYDKQDVGGAEFVSYTHASGDRLVKSIKKNRDTDDYELSLKKNAQGKQVITVFYEGEYDRDDKTVKVRGKKDITIYADPKGAQFAAEAGKDGATERPDDFSSAAVNDAQLKIGFYEVDVESGLKAKYKAVEINDIKVKTANTKVFRVEKNDELDAIGGTLEVATGINDPAIAGYDAELATRYLATTGTISLEAKLKPSEDDTAKKTTLKISVGKKWRVTQTTAQVNKKGSSTYVTVDGRVVSDWKDDVDVKDSGEVRNITGYDIVVDSGALTVTNGRVGNVEAAGDDFVSVDVEGGNIGDVKAHKIHVEDGTVGTIKVKGDDAEIDIDDGRVKAIDAKKADVKINGGTITGDVVGNTVEITSGDEEIPTTINGNVTAKSSNDPTINISSSSEAAVKVAGTLKGNVTLADAVSVETVDADYEYTVAFENFTGSITAIVNNPSNVTLDDESVVSLVGKLEADNVSIEEDSKLTIGEGRFESVDGEGILAVPANKLFIEDSIDDVTLQLTADLAVNETAFQAYADQVDVEDFNALGYTLEKKSANADVDKFVIKSVTFAGVSFDKTELSIAKGYSDTITVANYPNGTALPKDATIEWNVDANDDYISVTTEGNTATIKVLDFNSDYATDNVATITATVVDANGIAYDDYVVASAKVTATALPTSEVTLDTNKPITLGTGSVYQYIAKSSTGAVLSAASSDAQVATVELFNAADPRGYKFQINALKEGKAVITTTDANGASKAIEVTVTKVNGSLKADTTSYTFAPGAIYDVKFTVNGSTEVPVVSANGKVVSIAPRGNGVYRVTAQNPGTAYVVAKAGNTHVSVKFDVVAGATAKGVTGNNVSLFK